MKILLAVDGSECSNAAVAEVWKRPWPPQTEVRVISVDAPLDASTFRAASPTAYDDLVRAQREEVEGQLSHAVAELQNNAPDLIVTHVLRQGSPKDAILDEAEQWGADLIVVGSHGRGALQRLFLGSVSLAIATKAPCSVEIVRLPEAPESEPASANA